jgi:hypothetical protein
VVESDPCLQPAATVRWAGPAERSFLWHMWFAEEDRLV